MISSNHLPADYIPYSRVSFCGNIILGESLLLAVGDVIPLLIGSGPKPLIWIQGLKSPIKKEFMPLVESSVSLHPIVRVEEVGGVVLVRVEEKLLLAVEQIGRDEIVIHDIDLRPISLNVYGDDNGLMFGGVSIKNSTFKDVGTILVFEKI